jgi:Tfp pilus assembly protein PilE
MPDLNALLLDNLAVVVGVLAALIAVLVIVVLLQGIRLGRAVRAYREVVRDADGTSLHGLLAGNASALERAQERMSDIEAMHGLIDRRTQRSLQHIGMVRFNPFEDTGSDQSFAIALLDDRRDGVVISSLHGRANTRIFAKPVADGASPHNLSDEEAQAIRIAVEGTRPT